MMTRFLFWLLVLALTSACQNAALTPTVEAPRVAAKVLATVYVSPTPGQVEREATRLASSPTPTPVPPTPIPSATPYIGVFLASRGGSADSPSLIQAAGAFVTPQPPAHGRNPANEVFGATWMRSADASAGWMSHPDYVRSGDVQLSGARCTGAKRAKLVCAGATRAPWYVAKAPDISTEGQCARRDSVPRKVRRRGWACPACARRWIAQTDEERTEWRCVVRQRFARARSRSGDLPDRQRRPLAVRLIQLFFG
jgi:hypothetical protein